MPGGRERGASCRSQQWLLGESRHGRDGLGQAAGIVDARLAHETGPLGLLRLHRSSANASVSATGVVVDRSVFQRSKVARIARASSAPSKPKSRASTATS
jgi:hypothetical protein